MIEMAHRHGARVLVDGAQSIAHMGVDVQLLDCDFFVFSGHKIFAPTGIGVVYGKADILDTTPPWQGGGSMIVDVTFEKTIYNVPPARFEAGTGNIADAVGLGAALDYLNRSGWRTSRATSTICLTYATEQLPASRGCISSVRRGKKRACFLSCSTASAPKMLARRSTGKESRCAPDITAPSHPAPLRLETTVRPSLALYNTCEDIDALIAALLRIQAGRGHRGL